MLKIDLHIHSSDSSCGQHTPLEVMTLCRERGMEAIAITDHGPAITTCMTRGTFFDDRRFPTEFDGLRIFKGMESNIMAGGKTDVIPVLLPKIDVLAAGMHAGVLGPDDIEANTRAVIEVIEGDVTVDMITHPDQKAYAMDVESIARAAAGRGVALEINNSGLVLDKTDVDQLRRMIEAGQKHGALFALNSDGHTWVEFGHDEAARKFLDDMGSPKIDILNDWPLDRVAAHLAERKRLRGEGLTP